MLSLYIHIPFCQHKCNYCSFTSFGLEGNEDRESLIDQYVAGLEQEITQYQDQLGPQDIKTIYFGGGTPNLLGAERITRIITKIQDQRNLGDLAELSFEFNPYPQDQIFALIQTLNKTYKKLPRLRYSFGIQSLDDAVLKWSGRPYTFGGMTDFLRGLRDLKMENNVLNFDFIAFGKQEADKPLRGAHQELFFRNFVESGFAESFSIYTLEWHQGTPRDIRKEVQPMDDDILNEFHRIKQIVMDAGYQRYEISNFGKRGAGSIHNGVYRQMEEYLGLGVSAASLLVQNVECIMQNDFGTLNSKFGIPTGVRWTNTNNLKDYLAGKWKDESSVIHLSEQDILIEKFFLALRTSHGILDITPYIPLLVPNYESLLQSFAESGLVVWDGTHVQLTDAGMEVSNSIITELLNEI